MKQLLVLATALAAFPFACADSGDETSSNDLGVIGRDDLRGEDAGENPATGDDAKDSGAADHADGSSPDDTDDTGDDDVSDDGSPAGDDDVGDDGSSADDDDATGDDGSSEDDDAADDDGSSADDDATGDDGSSEDDAMSEDDNASGPTDLDDIHSGDDIAGDDASDTDGGRGVLDAGTTTGGGGQDSGDVRADGGKAGMATAITRAQLEVLWANEDDSSDDGSSDDGSSDDGSSDDNGLDPNDLFLRVSSLGTSCNESFVPLTCGGHWNLSIALPPQAQAVGVYDLEDSGISQYSSMSETSELQSDDPDDCGWGGGSIGPGTIDVLAIDDEQVRFRVQLESPIWDSNPNGEYLALRCQ